MDFRGIVEDTTTMVSDLVSDVLSWEVSPDTKIELISQIFGDVGPEFAQKLYADVSYLFDSQAIRSVIETNYNDQVYALAQKIVRDHAFNFTNDAILKEYFDVLLGRSEYAAFENAKSLDKHPTLTRMVVGETCHWCEVRQGVFVDPDYSLFMRHDDCDCLFIVKGYNNRNGRLNNYTKASVNSRFTDQNGKEVDWNERLRRIEAGEDRNNFKRIKES